MRWLVATFLFSENTTLPGSLRSQHRISGSCTDTHTNTYNIIFIYIFRCSIFIANDDMILISHNPAAYSKSELWPSCKIIFSQFIYMNSLNIFVDSGMLHKGLLIWQEWHQGHWIAQRSMVTESLTKQFKTRRKLQTLKGLSNKFMVMC